MGKRMIFLEYHLKSNSANIIWSLISTAGGLRQWIADTVEPDGDTFTFTWKGENGTNETRRASIVKMIKNDTIRFRWDDETDDNAYWEIKMAKSELTNDYHLMITDYAEEEDMDYIMDVWNQNYEELHRNTGL